MPTAFLDTMASKTDHSETITLPDAATIEDLRVEISIFQTFDDVEQIWRELEKQTAISCYQKFDFVDSWFKNLGVNHGLKPFIISGKNEKGETAFIWPFVLKTNKLGTYLTWPGEKHANYNMGMNRLDWAPSLNRRVILDTFRKARKILPFDGVHLHNQPETWNGRPNPFLTIKRNPSPSFGYWADFSDGFDTYINAIKSKRARKRIRWQQRGLSEMGNLTFERAATNEDVDRFLKRHFEMRETRFKSLGKYDALSEAGVREFFTDLSSRAPTAAQPPLELHALLIDGEIMSIYSGAVSGDRFSASFNSIDIGPASRYSVGDTLLHHMIQDCAKRGLKSFDLGIGEASYKQQWCNKTDIMFDTYLGFTVWGKICGTAASLSQRLKRMVKQQPYLSRFALWLQSVKNG